MKTATKALSSENQPTASLILPLKATILRQVDAVSELADDDNEQEGNLGSHSHHDPSVYQAKMAIKHDLETRFAFCPYFVLA